MTRDRRKVIRYSISFKQKVIREMEEEGLTLADISRRYGISGSHTVENWIKKFGEHRLLNKVVRVETKEEKDRIQELEAEIKHLKIALADSILARHALESLVEVVDEHYQTNVKKTLGQKLYQKPRK